MKPQIAQRREREDCGNNNYCPAESVSREYMSIFLDRAFLGMQ